VNESDARQLHDLVTRSRKELQAAVGNYEQLLGRLDELERELQSGAPGAEQLSAIERSFWAFPRLAPVRAAAPTDDGLEETRALLVEIRNRIVILEKNEQGIEQAGG
jgi:hypothetical protein